MSNTPFTFLLKNSFLWLIGWLSLGLVEAGLRFTIDPPPLILMISFTLFIYSLIGIILGAIYGIITLFIQRLWRGLKGSCNVIHFSMAACIATILSIYALLYFMKVGLNENTPMAFFKSILIFDLSIAMLFLLSFFFSWMDRKRILFTSYLSLLPSFWIITSLRLTRHREIFPPILQITTFFRALLLIIGSILCFFLLYLVFSLGRRFLNRWKATPLQKLSLVILPCIFLVFLFLLLREGNNESNIREIKNAPTGKPNIVFITLDTVRADHLSCYGYGRPTTPNLDKFSREGVLYKNACATASWTLPSHASMFTGKYPTRHGAHYNADSAQPTKSILKLSEDNITLAEILSEKGYRTAGIIGGPLSTSMFGLAQGFDYYNESFLNVQKDISFSLIYQVVDLFFSLKDFIIQHGYSGVKRLASQLNEAAFQWLEKNHEQPFFLFINYFDAHRPYLPPPAYSRDFGKVEKDIIVNSNLGKDSSYATAAEAVILSVIMRNHRLTPEEKDLFVSRYDGEIRYLDHCLGLFFERLKDLKVYDNTLIIITSDHGEAFGEHYQMDHGRTLYEELLWVPLIIKYPSTDLRRGVVEKRVSLVDFFPTILSYLDYSIPTGIDGEVFDKSDHPNIAEFYYNWMTPERYWRDLKSVYQGKYKYIWASNGLNELYDLEKDPGEKENIIRKFPQKTEAMQRTLNQWLSSFTPPDTKGETVKIDKSTHEKLRALGYVR